MLQTSNDGREGAPVEEEVGRERVGVGIADDQLSEPKDVLSPGLILVPLLASEQPGFAQPPSPQDLSHKAARGLNRSPSSASSRPRRSTPSTSLPPSRPHSRASTGGSVFLGTTCMRLHVSPQGLGPATDPPPRTAPGSRQARLLKPSLLSPGWPPRALLSRCCLQRQFSLASSP